MKGVSIGDAFGDSFFGENEVVIQHIEERIMPETKWEFTDDTVMSIAVFEQLEKYGEIRQDLLPKQFCKNHNLDEQRGYGTTARKILRDIDAGNPWMEVSKNVFDGMGSMGNGAAMRANVIGAFYFDNFSVVKPLAIQSAEITHANIEGIWGAIAVAIATALSTRIQLQNESFSSHQFIENIVQELPDTDTKSKIHKSLSITISYNIETVKSVLGNGVKMTAQDTVPFTI